MHPNIWVATAGSTEATLASLQSALNTRVLPFTVLDLSTLKRQPRQKAITAAVLVGGPLSSPLLDALRALSERRVATLVLVEGITDYQEAVLLGAGAVDVIGVPTSRARLESRLINFLRNVTTRAEAQHEASDRAVIPVEGVEIWPARRQVLVSGHLVELTRREFDLLLILAAEPDRVLTQTQLSGRTGVRPHEGRSVQSHLSRLRLKILRAGGPRLIESVRGVGYRLRVRRSAAEQC